MTLRKSTFFVILAVVLGNAPIAAKAAIDVQIMARPATLWSFVKSGAKAKFPHAFIHIVGQYHGVNINEWYGFFPTESKYFVYGPGEVRQVEDVGFAAISVSVDDATYERVISEIKNWRNAGPSYSVAAQNCVDLVYRVAKTLSLRTPDPRGRWPREYVEEMALNNPEKFSTPFEDIPDKSYVNKILAESYVQERVLTDSYLGGNTQHWMARTERYFRDAISSFKTGFLKLSQRVEEVRDNLNKREATYNKSVAVKQISDGVAERAKVDNARAALGNQMSVRTTSIGPFEISSASGLGSGKNDGDVKWPCGADACLSFTPKTVGNQNLRLIDRDNRQTDRGALGPSRETADIETTREILAPDYQPLLNEPSGLEISLVRPEGGAVSKGAGDLLFLYLGGEASGSKRVVDLIVKNSREWDRNIAVFARDGLTTEWLSEEQDDLPAVARTVRAHDEQIIRAIITVSSDDNPKDPTFVVEESGRLQKTVIFLYNNVPSRIVLDVSATGLASGYGKAWSNPDYILSLGPSPLNYELATTPRYSVHGVGQKGTRRDCDNVGSAYMTCDARISPVAGPQLILSVQGHDKNCYACDDHGRWIINVDANLHGEYKVVDVPALWLDLSQSDE